jgi:hypothetical protein
MLTTEREETTLYDGREWRTHYWMLRKETILRYAHEEVKIIRTAMYDTKQPIPIIEDLSNDFAYDSLEEDIWSTRKLSD